MSSMYGVVISMAIAIVLPFYTEKAYSLMFEPDEDKKKPKVHFVDERDNKKTLIMIGLGILYIIIGTFLSTCYDSSTMIGVSFGGLILILSNIIRNWRSFKKAEQLLILTIMLIVLMYIGNKIIY